MKETTGISTDRCWIYALHGSNFRTSPQRGKKEVNIILGCEWYIFQNTRQKFDLKKIVYLPVFEQRDFLWPYIFRIVDKVWKTEYN
jgi:hypothetical protein